MSGNDISFGPFVFNADHMVLTRNGQPVPIGGRGAALLQALLQADGAVVSKDTLLEAGWPGTIVEEGNLAVQIAALRKLLGQRADGQEWISTISRVGYRFVRSSEVDEAEPAGRKPRLAVLPFQNLSNDPEQDYLADGLVEEITTALSRFKSFAVIARNSAYVYKGRTVDLRQVGQELGAQYLLEGSVRRAGSRLRVAVQLIEATTGSNLWAERFDGALEDVFDMQDKITQSVAAVVQPSITRSEVERVRLKRTGNLTAYELYLKAVPSAFAMSAASVSEAISLLTRALKIDPDFTAAEVLLAFCYHVRNKLQLGDTGSADLERGKAHLYRALPHCGDDPSLLAQCGYMLCVGKSYDAGLALCLRAASENPNDAHALNNAGVVSLFAGDLGAAADYQLRALGLSPHDFLAHAQLTCMSHIRLVEGKFEEAIDWAIRSLVVQPEYSPTYWMLIAANAYLGRLDEAKSFLRELEKFTLGSTLSRIRRGQNTRDPWRVEVFLEGLRLAGMPEGES